MAASLWHPESERLQSVDRLAGRRGQGDTGQQLRHYANDGDDNTSTTFSGSGRLVKVGEGTFVLTGDNTFTGGTIVSEGTPDIAVLASTGSRAASSNHLINVDTGEGERGK